MAIERRSRQRDAILNNLKTRCDHPTAMELYLSVRETVPNLSLGTLYRNLAQLEESGMVLRIKDGTFDRFDGQTQPHAHFKCTHCGKVYDAYSLKNDSLKFCTEDENISQIYGFSLMLYGKCKSCDKAV